MRSPFRGQTAAVLRTYTSWWMTWLSLVVYLVILIAAVFVNWLTSISTNSVSLDRTGTNWESLPADLTTVTSLVINSNLLGLQPDTELRDSSGRVAKATYQNVLRVDSLLRTKGKFPNLKRLVVWSSLTESQLIDLLEVQQLRSLWVLDLPELTERGWAALARQPLEEIQILSNGRPIWDAGLWPSTIKTLLVQDDQFPGNDPDDSHLRPLLRLPQLQQVQVHLVPDAHGHLRATDFAVLSKMPSLKHLYVAGFVPGFVAQVQSELPNVIVRPAYYQSRRITRVLMITGIGIIPLLLILHILSLQFVSPKAALIPLFHHHHWRATYYIVFCWATLQIVGLLAAGCGWISAISMACVLLIPIFGVTWVLNLMPRFPGYVHFQFMILATIMSLSALCSFVQLRPAESDWMFQGQRSDVAFTLIVLEIASAIGLRQFFLRLSRNLTERAEGSVSFEMWNLSAMQKWYLSYDSNYKGQNRIWGAGQQRRLQAALNCPRTSHRFQSLLWRASQHTTSAWFSLVMGFAILVGGSSTVILLDLFGISQHQQQPRTLWPAALQATFMTYLIPGILLAQKRQYLASHLLMSCGRREWVHLVFRESARDFIPALVASSACLIAYACLSPPDWWPSVHVGLLSLAMLCSVYGSTLLLLSLSNVKRLLFVLAIAAPCVGFILIAIVQGPLASFEHDFVTLGKWLAWPPTWWIGAIAFAAIAIKSAHDCWMNWELG